MSVRRIKRPLRQWAEQAGQWLGRLDAREQALAQRLTVLTFHRVLPDARAAQYPFPSIVVSQSAFASVLAVLREHYHVLGLSSALAAAKAGALPEGRPVACITFDDGYADNLLLAAPLLQQAALPATFYAVAGLVGTELEFWYDVAARQFAQLNHAELQRHVSALVGQDCKLPERWSGLPDWMRWMKALPPVLRDRLLKGLPDQGPDPANRPLDRVMTVDELRQLMAQGHDIGSHSMTHPLLPQLAEPALQEEVHGSRLRLQQWLQAPVEAFCYPNGDHDDRVVACVQLAGYRHATTTAHGSNGQAFDNWRLRRVNMDAQRFMRPNGTVALASLRALLSSGA